MTHAASSLKCLPDISKLKLPRADFLVYSPQGLAPPPRHHLPISVDGNTILPSARAKNLGVTLDFPFSSTHIFSVLVNCFTFKIGCTATLVHVPSSLTSTLIIFSLDSLPSLLFLS